MKMSVKMSSIFYFILIISSTNFLPLIVSNCFVNNWKAFRQMADKSKHLENFQFFDK